MKAYADLADLPEDERIAVIAAVAVVGAALILYAIYLSARDRAPVTQCGTVRIATGAVSQTATISAVDTTRTVVSVPSPPSDGARLELQNATTIRAWLPHPVDHDVPVSWELRAFPPTAPKP